MAEIQITITDDENGEDAHIRLESDPPFSFNEDGTLKDATPAQLMAAGALNHWRASSESVDVISIEDSYGNEHVTKEED